MRRSGASSRSRPTCSASPGTSATGDTTCRTTRTGPSPAGRKVRQEGGLRRRSRPSPATGSRRSARTRRHKASDEHDGHSGGPPAECPSYCEGGKPLRLIALEEHYRLPSLESSEECWRSRGSADSAPTRRWAAGWPSCLTWASSGSTTWTPPESTCRCSPSIPIRRRRSSLPTTGSELARAANDLAARAVAAHPDLVRWPSRTLPCRRLQAAADESVLRLRARLPRRARQRPHGRALLR